MDLLEYLTAAVAASTAVAAAITWTRSRYNARQEALEAQLEAENQRRESVRSEVESFRHLRGATLQQPEDEAWARIWEQLEEELSRPTPPPASEPSPKRLWGLPDGVATAVVAGIFGLLAATATTVISSMMGAPDCLAFVDRLLAIDERSESPGQAQAAAAALSWGGFEACGDATAFLAALDE